MNTAEEDWFDFVMLQTGHDKSLTFDILNSWKNKYNRTATLPFLEGEACYEGIAKVPKNLTRKMAYTSIMCGSFGYSYGAEGIWNAIWDENDTFQLWVPSRFRGIRPLTVKTVLR